MLNSTKTWKEKLWDRFKSPLGYYSIDNKNNSMYDLEKFIDDLRKRDMEALIEMFNRPPVLTRLTREKLIKDYYEK